MPLPISLAFAGVFALFNLWLAYRCVRIRLSGPGGVGDLGIPVLQARMRAHANFVEYTPFVLILMALLEYSGGSTELLKGVGIVLFAGASSSCLWHRTAPVHDATHWRGGNVDRITDARHLGDTDSRARLVADRPLSPYLAAILAGSLLSRRDNSERTVGLLAPDGDRSSALRDLIEKAGDAAN